MGQHNLVVVGIVAALMSAGVSGCATTSAQKVSKTVSISYKYDGQSTKMASLPRRSTPRSIPAPYIPRSIKPAPMPAPGKTFDQASVDRDLYKHQRVGKTYTVMGQTYTPKHNPDYDRTGEASWYGPKFNGKPTATGEKFNMNDLTAAHRTLPLNSMVFVTNKENGRTLMVRVNDRGPFAHGRIIDLSKASAEALGITTQGVAQVRVQYAGPADPMAAGRSILPKAPKPVPYPKENYVEAPRSTAPAPAPAQPRYAAPSTPSPIAPSRPQSLRPEPAPEDGGDVTLTIEGPIHVAKYNGGSNKPRLIQTVYRTQK